MVKVGRIKFTIGGKRDILTGELPQKGPVVGMGSERLSTDMGLIIMATPHKVLRYMGFGQKSL